MKATHTTYDNGVRYLTGSTLSRHKAVFNPSFWGVTLRWSMGDLRFHNPVSTLHPSVVRYRCEMCTMKPPKQVCNQANPEIQQLSHNTGWKPALMIRTANQSYSWKYIWAFRFVRVYERRELRAGWHLSLPEIHWMRREWDVQRE